MRRLLLAVALLLVPVACGSDGGDGDGDATGAPASDAAALQVSARHPEPLRPGPVTWTVELVNGGDEPVVVRFADGQRAEVVLRQGGQEVYRWGRSQMFSQELGETEVAPGDTRTFELEDVLEVDPGEYELDASITASDREDLVLTFPVTVQPR